MNADRNRPNKGGTAATDMGATTNSVQDMAGIYARHFLIAAGGGIGTILLLLLIPTDGKNDWLLGYSRNRVALISLALFGTVLLGGFSFLLRKRMRLGGLVDRFFITTSTGGLWGNLFVGVASLVIVLGIFAVINALWTPDVWVGAYLIRLSPFVLWVVLLGFQSLWISGKYYQGSHLSHRILYTQSWALVPVLTILFGFVLLSNRSYYIELAQEPAPVERLTFLSLLVVGAVSMLIAYRLSRPAGWRNRQVIFFALFAGVLVFMAMEEISWGQRILGLEIPQFFLEYNAQENINLHNILHTYTSIRTHQIVAVGLFVFGVVLPFWDTRSKSVQSLLKLTGAAIPPSYQSLAFFVAAVVTYANFPTSREDEYGEFLLSLCLVLFILYAYLKLAKSDPQVSEDK